MRFNLVLGEDCSIGAAGGLIRERVIGDSPPFLGLSNESTALIRLAEIAWAIAAAWAGDSLVTSMLIRTVFKSVVALTSLASWSGDTDKPRESIAGWRTIGDATVLTYD
jgi:hypothetical protein